MEIVDRTENKILNRVEISFKWQHIGKATPSRKDVMNLVKTLEPGSNPELIIVKDCNTRFGQPLTTGLAFIYSSEDATLLFVSCMEENNSGQKYSLGDGRIRDRFGRFPWGDGSSLNYLLEFIRPPLTNMAIVDRIDCEEIVDLLQKLTGQCGEEKVGHTNYQNGKNGLDIRGFLDSREVYTLRKGLAGRGWGVSSEEPLDGGVRDVVKHLSTILKAAERNGVGIVLRYHN